MKSKKESDKALLASVTEEMAQPRVVESARIEADKQRTAKVGKPAQLGEIAASSAGSKRRPGTF